MNDPLPHKLERVLLLQGPLGPFFADLARVFSAKGIETHRACFNAGDVAYGWADHMLHFRKPYEDWPEELARYVAKYDIQGFILYGDSRYYHRVARKLAEKLGLPCLCLEEGYLRPHFITAELGGNNNNSMLSRDPEVIRAFAGEMPPSDSFEPIGPVFGRQGWFAWLYYWAKGLCGRWFANYHHHRPGQGIVELVAWIWAFPRKQMSKIRELGVVERLIAEHSGQIFIIPLQVAVDSQLVYHSDFNHIKEFIAEVIRSFAASAEYGDQLVIKHHPMDRGFHHYGGYIQKLSEQAGIEKRVKYGFDFDLHALLRHAKGCVTVNSTVGVSALAAAVPVKALGRSLYDIAGMTNQMELDDFWTNPGNVDRALFAKWQAYIYDGALIYGSFYRQRKVTSESICSLFCHYYTGC